MKILPLLAIIIFAFISCNDHSQTSGTSELTKNADSTFVMVADITATQWQIADKIPRQPKDHRCDQRNSNEKNIHDKSKIILNAPPPTDPNLPASQETKAKEFGFATVIDTLNATRSISP